MSTQENKFEGWGAFDKDSVSLMNFAQSNLLTLSR